jgi:hypothetical protein
MEASSACQRRALPQRLITAALGRPYPRLPRPTHHRRQDPPRSHPLLKALHRSREVPDHHISTGNTAVRGLTSIGASAPPSSGAGQARRRLSMYEHIRPKRTLREVSCPPTRSSHNRPRRSNGEFPRLNTCASCPLFARRPNSRRPTAQSRCGLRMPVRDNSNPRVSLDSHPARKGGRARW